VSRLFWLVIFISLIASSLHLFDKEFVDKYGASATKASSAQSRVKMIEKMRKEGKLDPPPMAITEKIFKPSLLLPDPPKGIGEKLLVLEGADIGYGDEGKPILQGIDLVLNRGMKLILRGPNGAGTHAFVCLSNSFSPRCELTLHLTSMKENLLYLQRFEENCLSLQAKG